ncbi:MAG: DUF4911 domain-containing protein [Desulfovibrio sp.]|nr:DUF4911 domain-containing protein [Desulfovibrio sp.]
MPAVPVYFPKRKKRWKKRLGVPPGRSARLYVVIAPSAVGLFRFLLEAHDNLGLMTVLDRRRAALLLRFAPGMEQEMREFIEDVKAMLPCSDPLILPGAESAEPASARRSADPRLCAGEPDGGG